MDNTNKKTQEVCAFPSLFFSSLARNWCCLAHQSNKGISVYYLGFIWSCLGGFLNTKMMKFRCLFNFAPCFLASWRYSPDGLSVLCSPAVLGGRLGPGSRCWQGRRLDQPDSLSSCLSQQPPGSHLPGSRNGYVGVRCDFHPFSRHFCGQNLLILILLLLIDKMPSDIRPMGAATLLFFFFFCYSKIWHCFSKYKCAATVISSEHMEGFLVYCVIPFARYSELIG